jgi:hypothetical protein
MKVKALMRQSEKARALDELMKVKVLDEGHVHSMRQSEKARALNELTKDKVLDKTKLDGACT